MRGTKERADEIYEVTLQQQKIQESDRDSDGLEKLNKVEAY